LSVLNECDMPVITLLTDFGLADEYVGVMKGVILSTLPEAVIVDISHEIAPHDIRQAAYMLMASYPYFEPGSIHVIVVDPGVGTDRRILYAEVDGHRFLAPDNGVLSLLMSQYTATRIKRVENQQYWRPFTSQTFHGRDIFAPVAAHLAADLATDQLGGNLARAELTYLPDIMPQITADGIVAGCIIAVDRFGNLITNIQADWLAEEDSALEMERIVAEVSGQRIVGSRRPYKHQPLGEAQVLINSRGYLEIAVKQDSAANVLQVAKGEPVVIKKR